MWQKRCLVVAPVLAFVMTTLLLSCGGSSSTALPSPTATPITLIQLRICEQAPSNGAACTQATTDEIPLMSSNSFLLYAQGEFSSNGIISFQSIGESVTWFVNNSLLNSDGQGFFNSHSTVGCSCVTAASGTVVSPPVLIGVGQSPSLCSPCPASPP